MRRSLRSFARFAPQVPAESPEPAPAPLTFELVTGRLRLARHALVAITGAAGAWAWFGAAGLVLVLIWAWHRAPWPGQRTRVIVGRVTSADLGAFRTVAWCGPLERLEIFHDELPPAELAAIRRAFKEAASACDRTEHVEPV
jgi:hypothetical protein